MTLTLDHLTKAPFNLDRNAVDWVERTFQTMKRPVLRSFSTSTPGATTGKRK